MWRSRRAFCCTRCCVGADWFIIVITAALGLCVGSFLNVCIHRLWHENPEQRSLLHPPSTCPHCKQRIVWRDNIPVFSWLWLRGKCRWCHKPISIQYPIIEASVGLLWVVALLYYGFTMHALAAAIFGTILVGIGVIDARHKIIPDELSVSGLVLGLSLSLSGGLPGFLQALLGAAVGWSVLWVVRELGGLILRQEAMGWGDIKRSEEHTSELQSPCISYAVFCLKKKKIIYPIKKCSIR